jgi:Ca2+-binding RTX toxin-like protein
MPQGDTLTTIENLTGSNYNDTLTGDAGANVLSGGTGNDTLAGGAGADTLTGGSGTDTADYSASGSAVTVNLLTNVNTGGDAASDSLSGIENVTGSASTTR